MKLVRIISVLIFFVSSLLVLVLAHQTKKSFVSFDYHSLMHDMFYDLDFITQGISDPQGFFESL